MPPDVLHPRTSGVESSLSWVLLIVLVAVIVHASMSSPVSTQSGAEPTKFSPANAMQIVEQLALKPHPVGSLEHERVQNYLLAQMQIIGIDTTVETHTGIEIVGKTMIAGRVSNIIGRLKGIANTRAVVLVAHYDTVGQAPGAGDDGGAVAAILEAARAIKAGPPLRNDVIVLLTDGEELGLLGARAAAQHDIWLQHAGIIMNFEGRGDRGPSWLFETSSGNHSLIGEFVKAVPGKSGSSLLYTIYKHMPNDTDFTVFKKAGVPGLNFSWTGRLEAYHTRLDTPATLDEKSLQQDGRYALQLTRAFGNIDLHQQRFTDIEDEVYFTVLGMAMMHYPECLVAPFAGLLTLALLTVLVVAVRRGYLSLKKTLTSAGVSLLLLLVVMLTMLAISRIEILAFSHRMLVGDVPANTLLFVGLLLPGFAVALLILGHFRECWGTLSLAAGACLLVWLLTIIMTWALPLASYLFFWPLMFATLNLVLLTHGHGRDSQGLLRLEAWLCALPTLILLAPTIYLLFVGLTLTPALGVLCGLLSALGLLLTVPLAIRLAPTRAALLTLLLAGLVSIALGGILSRPTPQHPKPDTLVYRLDGDSGRAQWASFDATTDPWTARMLTISPQHGKLSYYGANEADALVAEAPPMKLAVPEVNVISVSRQGDAWTVRMQVSSKRKASWLHLEPQSEVLAATIDGEDVHFPLADSRSNVPSLGKPAWALNLFGYNQTGVTLTIKLKGPTCSATLTDEEYGLPPMAERRPQDRMAWGGSDYTIVTRRVSLCREHP